MKQAKIPANEKERIVALNSFCILDTQPEPSFDRITRLACRLLEAPIALISLVDHDRQWFKSRVGVEVSETHRDVAFCAHAILSNEIFLIPDATKDERFADNPLVTGPPFIRTYIGMPLNVGNDHLVGTLCVIYDKVTEINPDKIAFLKNLAAVVVDELELKKSLISVEEAHEKSQKQTAELDLLSRNMLELSGKLQYEIDVKNRFFNILAHDLRSPFNNLLGLTEIMVTMGDKFSKEQMIDFARRMQRSSQDAFTLVENLLEWARVQMHGETVEKVPSNLDEESKNAVDQCQESADAKGIILAIKSSGCRAIIDPPAFRTVVRNLIANAIKFSTKDQVIEISARDDGDEVIVTVKDQGVGIAPDIIKNLFRVDMKTTSEGTSGERGTGLGLPLCSELVDQMGGRIWVESEVGKGSRFLFSVPKAS